MNYKNIGLFVYGDYDASGRAKWSELTDAYQKYWEYIGCVQLPHHGSFYNFNQELLKMDAFLVISAGYANKYHHPHASVIRAFFLKSIMSYIVIEQAGSAAFLKIQ